MLDGEQTSDGNYITISITYVFAILFGTARQTPAIPNKIANEHSTPKELERDLPGIHQQYKHDCVVVISTQCADVSSPEGVDCASAP